jgi:hypothetical protein
VSANDTIIIIIMIFRSLKFICKLEKWNPYEIALFESSILLYGKNFHMIQSFVSVYSRYMYIVDIVLCILYLDSK